MTEVGPAARTMGLDFGETANMLVNFERGGVDADAGARWIEEMGAKNRYVLDVWAGG